MLKFEDVIELTLKFSDRINTYWHMYIVIHVGLLMWLATITSLDTMPTIIIMLMYGIFSLYSILNFMKMYMLFDLAFSECKLLAEKIEFATGSKINENIQRISYKHRTFFVVLAHISSAVSVLYLLWNKMIL